MIFACLRPALYLVVTRNRHAATCVAVATGLIVPQPHVAAESPPAAVTAARVTPSPAAAPPPAAVASPRASGALPTPLELDRLAAQSVHRWELSEHGEMLVRIVPRQLRPSELPEPESVGARLTGLYCVQCHYLPSPAMHDGASWESVVQRMIPRMRGEGNMGRLMTEMMLGPVAYGRDPVTRRRPDTGRDPGGGADPGAGRDPGAGGEGGSRPEIAGNASNGGDAGNSGGRAEPRPLSAPSRDEAGQIVAYLQRHAMRPLTDNLSPTLERDLSGEDGRMFVAACGQCHVLPDPAAHGSDEWPAVVQRMEKHMRATNRVVDTAPDPREPQLRPSRITRFLQRNASGPAR